MSRLKDMNRALKMHDRSLYCQETKPGRIDVYRKGHEGCSPPHFIMALTDTWTAQGRPVPWGIEVVLNRLKAHDLWRDDRFVENYIAEQEKVEESRQRGFRNSVESFLYDFRSQFQKATNDINTSTLNKNLSKGRREICLS